MDIPRSASAHVRAAMVAACGLGCAGFWRSEVYTAKSILAALASWAR
jgi:hypothetical protein